MGMVVVAGDENPESKREGCFIYRSGLGHWAQLTSAPPISHGYPGTGLLTQSTNAYQQSS